MNFDEKYGLVDGVPTCWVTRDNDRIRITEMADSHIQNTVNMLRRMLDSKRDGMLEKILVGANFDPDGMAEYYAERDLDVACTAFEMYEFRIKTLISAFTAEQERRARLRGDVA